MARKESFIGPSNKQAVGDPNLISTRIPRNVDKRKGKLNALTADNKMRSAIGKALSMKSGLDDPDGASYFISGDKMYVTARGGGVQTKKGEKTTYSASGRFILGKAFKDHVCYFTAEFSITFRDTVDDLGLPDVAVVEPTTIDILPKGTPITPPTI